MDIVRLVDLNVRLGIEVWVKWALKDAKRVEAASVRPVEMLERVEAVRRNLRVFKDIKERKAKFVIRQAGLHEDGSVSLCCVGSTLPFQSTRRDDSPPHRKFSADLAQTVMRSRSNWRQDGAAASSDIAPGCSFRNSLPVKSPRVSGGTTADWEGVRLLVLRFRGRLHVNVCRSRS